MPWIEGVGDEVTIFFAVLLFLCVIVSAWFSTGIRDIPFISVIIVQLTRRRRRRNQEENQQDRNVDQTGTVSDQGQEGVPARENEGNLPQEGETSNSTTSIGETAVNDGHTQVQAPETNDISRDTTLEQNTETSDQSDNGASIPEAKENSEHMSHTELRKRRLEFLSGKAQTCDIDEHAERIGNGEKLPDNDQGDAMNKTSSEVKNDKTSTSDLTESESVVHGASNFSASLLSGQTQTNEDGVIRVKIKFLNDTQRQVEANLNETIGHFRRRHFSTEISESKLVRFIYNGQDLRNDSSTLQSYNIGDNSVLHCLITQPRPEDQTNAGVNEDNGLDIGVLMFPLFGLLLSIVWYLRFTYRQIFNVTSTLTLGGITFLYLAALLSSFRAQRVHEHID